MSDEPDKTDGGDTFGGEDSQDEAEPRPVRLSAFRYLGQRNRPLALVWVIAEFVRLLSATLAVCCVPCLLIEVIRSGFANWHTWFLAWQFYGCLIAAGLTPCLTYKLADFVSERIPKALGLSRPTL